MHENSNIFQYPWCSIASNFKTYSTTAKKNLTEPQKMVFKATKHSLHCTWSRLTVEEGEKKLSHWVTAELIKKSQTDKKGNLCIFKHLKFKSSNVWGKNGVKKSHLFNTKQYCVRKYKQNKKQQLCTYWFPAPIYFFEKFPLYFSNFSSNGITLSLP